MNIMDLALLERLKSNLDEMIQKASPLKSMYCDSPKHAANMTRYGKQLRKAINAYLEKVMSTKEK